MKKLLQTSILTILSVGLFAILATILPGIDMFDPLSRALNDIAVTDIYYSSLRDASPEDNDKILIVDTHMSDRREIAEAVANAAAGGATAIGIDITFIYHDSDTEATRYLCETIEASRDKIVAAVHLNKWDKITQTYVSDIPTALDSLELDRGFTNILTSSDNSFIRNYMVAQGVVPSFAEAIADKYLREYGDELDLSPGPGVIHFVPQQFKKLKASESTAIRRHADGKIVLLGALGSDDDYHYTPIGVLNGVEIQAYSIESMLSHPSRETSMTGTWIICILLVFVASLGFSSLRKKFECRNITANRYTYAVLGLGNIMYPTIAIIITIFLIGFLYLLTSVYIPPLVILGSLAFIPVSYDIIGILHHIMPSPHFTALILLLILPPAISSASVVNSSGKNPTAQIHSVYITHNEIQEGQKGMYIHVDFDIREMHFKTAEVNAYFYDKDGNSLTTTNTLSIFDDLDLVSHSEFWPYYDKLRYTDYQIFFPYSEIPAPLATKTPIVFTYTIGIFDNNHKELATSSPHAFLYTPSTEEGSVYMTATGASGYFKKLEILGDTVINNKKGLNIKAAFEVNGMKGEKGFLECFFFDEEGEILKQDSTNKTYCSADGEVSIFREFTPTYAFSTYKDLRLFIPYDAFNLPPGSRQWLKMGAGICDSDNEVIECSEIVDFYFNPLSTESQQQEPKPRVLIDRTKVYHNQIVNGKKGIQFLTDFTTIGTFNTEKDKLYKAVVIITNDADNMWVAFDHSLKPEFSYGDVLLCDTAYFQPSEHFIERYEDFSVFIPYDKFLPDSSQGRIQEHAYCVLFLDENNTFLEMGGAQKFYYNAAKKSSRPYKMGKGMSSDLNHISASEDVVDGQKGITINGVFKGKIDRVGFTFFDMDGYRYTSMDRTFRSLRNIELDRFPIFLPYEKFDCVPVGEEQQFRIMAHISDDDLGLVALNEPIFVTVTGQSRYNYKSIFDDLVVDDLFSSSEAETNPVKKSDSTKTVNFAYSPLKDDQIMPLSQTVKFAFKTPENSKFYNRNFELSFITNSHSLKYTISDEKGQHVVPRADIEAGLHVVTLPEESCELVMVDDAMNMHKIHFIYDEEKSLRQNSTLYILAIGVNNYPAKNLDNLKYAEADANAVAKIFADNHKNTFGNICKKVLVGKDVTSNNIEKELDSISQNAGVNDMVVIFFAGHGLIDDHNKYYLATSEITDGNIPRKGGFSSALFHELVEYIDCKVVIFIDACYSGKLMEGMRSGAVSNEEFFLQQLASTQKGINLFMSSKADTRSKEDPLYCHGIFTQALIEACDFNKSDSNRDGKITIEEIRNYLKQRIPEMTKGQQFPLHLNKEDINYPLFIK